jgi:hypothetical protein
MILLHIKAMGILLYLTLNALYYKLFKQRFALNLEQSRLPVINRRDEIQESRKNCK